MIIGFCIKESEMQVENSVAGELVLDAVPIVTPNCDLVVPSLSLTVIIVFIIFINYIFFIIIVTPTHSHDRL